MKSVIRTAIFALTTTLIHPAQARNLQFMNYAPVSGGHSSILSEANRYVGGGNPTGYKGPWCRWFINFILQRTGHHLSNNSGMVYDALKLGPHTLTPKEGDIVVMPGHATFFVGYDGKGNIIGLGGNQHHRVQYSQFKRYRVIAFVEPQ